MKTKGIWSSLRRMILMQSAVSKLSRGRLSPGTLSNTLLLTGLALGILCQTDKPAQADGWTVVFEDNFDGSQLDLSKWWTRYIYSNGTQDHFNKEKEVYRDGDHHVLSKGILALVATKVGSDSDVRPYESGMIRSKQTFRYGYFEARIKLPPGKGLWPAFWLNPDYNSEHKLVWPPEIDIMEFAPNEVTEHTDMVHSNVNVSKNTKVQGGAWIYRDPAFNAKFTFYKAPGDMTKDWHVYGLLWDTDDTATVYLDGKKLWQRKYKWIAKDGGEAGPAHILVNLAVGGNWAGKGGIDQSAFPASLQVDYVRVCQRSTASSAKTSCGDSQFAPK